MDRRRGDGLCLSPPTTHQPSVWRHPTCELCGRDCQFFCVSCVCWRLSSSFLRVLRRSTCVVLNTHLVGEAWPSTAVYYTDYGGAWITVRLRATAVYSQTQYTVDRIELSTSGFLGPVLLLRTGNGGNGFFCWRFTTACYALMTTVES